MARSGTRIIGWVHLQCDRWQWCGEHGGDIYADAENADGSECDADYSVYPDGHNIMLPDGLPTATPSRQPMPCLSPSQFVELWVIHHVVMTDLADDRAVILAPRISFYFAAG